MADTNDVKIEQLSPWKKTWQRTLDALLLAACYKCHGEGKVGNRHDTKFGGQISVNIYQTVCPVCEGTGFKEKGKTQ